MAKPEERFLPVAEEPTEDWRYEQITTLVPPNTELLAVATFEQDADGMMLIRPHQITGGLEYTREEWARAFRHWADIYDPPTERAPESVVEEEPAPVASPENTAYVTVEGDPEQWARELL